MCKLTHQIVSDRQLTIAIGHLITSDWVPLANSTIQIRRRRRQTMPQDANKAPGVLNRKRTLRTRRGRFGKDRKNSSINESGKVLEITKVPISLVILIRLAALPGCLHRGSKVRSSRISSSSNLEPLTLGRVVIIEVLLRVLSLRKEFVVELSGMILWYDFLVVRRRSRELLSSSKKFFGQRGSKFL